MKKVSIVVILALLLLGGCGGKNAELQRAMALRAKLLTASVTFWAKEYRLEGLP